MATVEQHIVQWKHNRRFARTIECNFRDWQINVIFYTALHAIDAALASLGVKVTNHAERNEKVRTNASFSGVRNQYLNLYRISCVTRYDANPDEWLPQEYLTVQDLVSHLLRPIETECGQLIGKNKAVKFDPLELQS